MDKDYYEILGITEDEKKLTGSDFEKVVKKKYRNLCKEWHPDKFTNASAEEQKKADEMITDINNANEVLSNQQKRQEYDMKLQYGENGFDPFAGFGGDPFADMRNDFMNPFGRRARVHKRPGNDRVVYADLTFEEMLNGCNKTIEYERLVKCKYCNGTGSENGMKEKCPTCGGTGFIRKTHREGNTMFMEERPCPDCHGTGTKSGGKKCTKCGGSGLETEKCSQYLNIPAGIENGIRIGYNSMGDESPDGGENGNLLVIIRYPNETIVDGIKFKRYEDDIVGELKLNLYDAWCGIEKEIKLANGKKVKIKIPELCEDGKQLKLNKMGINNERISHKGDCYIVVKYEIPKKITSKQKGLLKDFYNGY